MSHVHNYLGRWLRTIGPAIVGYSVVGLLVDASIPQCLPGNALTMAVGNAAKAGPRFVVCPQILFGFLYNVLFFSIFAGLRAEYAQIEPLHWGLDPYQALIAWRIPSCSRAHGGLK